MRQASENIIEATALFKSFGGFAVIQNLDLKIKRHAIHSLVGPNGAGKTTVFNLLTRFLQPDRGTIRFDGQDITSISSAKLSQMGVVRSFQISSVFPAMSVTDNLKIALQRATGQSLVFWRRSDWKPGKYERAVELMEAFGLLEYRHTEAGRLSYGRKRALELATTLALDPQVLLLDEPMAGLGSEEIKRTTELIASIAKGRTVVMVEHNLSVVAELSTCITVLSRGNILAEGPFAEVASDPAVRSAYMGGRGAS